MTNLANPFRYPSAVVVAWPLAVAHRQACSSSGNRAAQNGSKTSGAAKIVTLS
jgi:hypothetical protein